MSRCAIRRANAGDAELLASEFQRWRRHFKHYDDVPFSRNHTLTMLTAYLQSPASGCFVSIVKGELAGVILGMIYQPLYSPAREASEVHFWVHPEYRCSGLGVDLLKSYKEWAIAEGACRVNVSCNDARVERMYNRLGYATVGIVACSGGARWV